MQRGHVRRRGRSWVAVVNLGYDENGRRKQRWLSGFRTKADASAKLTEVLSELQQGTYVEPSKETLGDYLREWIDAVRVTVRASTWTSYKMYIESFIVPHLGGTPLQRLTVAQLNGFYAQLLESGRRRRARNGSMGLSKRTVRYIHTIIRKALADGVDWDRLARNVADQATPPRGRDAPEMRVWNAGELRTFLDHMREQRLYVLWLLLTTTGARRGEVAGLTWKACDLDAGRIYITQTLISVGNVMAASTPKTAKGRRSIALDPATLAALKAHRRSQAEERLAWGPAYEDNDLVFAWENGKPIHPDLLSQQFKRAVKRLGLPHLTPHGLRHSYATLALKAGVHPKTISERLGHSSISITLDTYSHAVPGLEEAAAAKIAKLVVG